MDVNKVIVTDSSQCDVLHIDYQNYYNIDDEPGEFNTDTTPDSISDELMKRFHEAWRRLAAI